MPKITPRIIVILITLHVLSADLFCAATNADDDFAWIEGEKPAATNVEPTLNGWGNQHYLSGDNWLSVSIDAKKVANTVPQEGVMLSYKFATTTEGDYQVWARIGFEFVRAPFDWRIDGKSWTRIDPDQLTTDLMEIGDWCEVAWIQLGNQQLNPGDHTLEIRLPKTKNSKGAVNRILFALDACCISTGEFSPYSKYKPGESYRDAKDEEAAKQIFKLPQPRDASQRASTSLAGLWEVCRHDEQQPGETATPIKDFPDQPRWRAIKVPGDKNKARPDLLFAHRLWYRTRFEIPESLASRSIFLVFPANNLNTTIMVNGKLCGFDKNPLVRLQFDVTDAVKPGVNELCVGIRDAWYGYKNDPKDPMQLRRRWNLPMRYMTSGFQELVYPVWRQTEMGIIGTPELVAAGETYVTDVFCKPSVGKRQLGLEITLAGNREHAKTVNLRIEAVNDKSDTVEMQWQRNDIAIADTPRTVSIDLDWKNPKLWWPDDPNCYRLRTTVVDDGRSIDIQETLFGFREWTIDGIDLKLNGVRWQGFTEHGVPGKTPQEYLAALKNPTINYGFGRMWPQHGGHYQWLGMEPEAVLTFMDRGGALIRRSGYLDGEAAGYLPAILPELGKNWIDHVTAWIKGERNHPSVMIWSIENELNFINARNLGQLDTWEPILAKAWQQIQQVDPTRPIMVDGGGATLAQTLPVHGDHYTTKSFGSYPQLAYEANAQQNPWLWDQKRPKFIGEELFAAGINPKYAYFGGEQVFLGKSGNRPAVGKAMQVISQGYRWFGITACDFCQSPSDADGSQYRYWAPRVVLVRQWDYSFASGRTATRTIGIFNNTRFAAPITFAWQLVLDGKEIANSSTVHNVPPGECEKFDVTLPIPSTTKRLEGEWILTLSVEGKQVFRDVKAISVLPAGDDLPIPPALAQGQPGDLFVFDPQGNVVEYLRSRSIKFTQLDDLTPPPPGKLWLVGANALTPADTSTTAFAAYAADGGRVILLEQDHALRYQGVRPAELQYETNLGRTAFAEDTSSPLLRGLNDKDFFTWEPGEVVYKNAYAKPQRGARSLVQCNEALANSALVSIPVNEGLLTLCQLLVGEKLTNHPAAETLFLNLLDYHATYKLTFQETVAVVDKRFAGVLDSINLQYQSATDPITALSQGKIAIVSATLEHLGTLTRSAKQVQAYTDAGGWIVLHGLTPDGLADFNTLVGYQHILRPFRRERVTFAVPKHRLLAGVSLGDVALYSSEKIFSWQSGRYVASDTFSHVVDLDEVAPFGKWDSDAWYNFVNGMVSADGWKYIQNHPATERSYKLTLPRPETLVAWEWDGNVMYNPTRQVELVFDGDESSLLTFDVPPDGEPARFDITPPRRATKVVIRHAKYDDTPEKRRDNVPLIGCDNIAFFAERPDNFRQQVKPMLNVGGLVEYPRGKGGIVLANLLFKETEEVPINATKKRNVLATILKNLGAPFGGGKAVIPGAHLAYTPIDISKQCTQFRNEHGWFGNRRFTLKDLPEGNQQFAGVNFDIYEFATSPLPNCIMLEGPGLPNQLPKEVRGIPVGRKADALFFLHTAQVKRPRNKREIKDEKYFEVVRYRIHYADGEEVILPIQVDQQIGSYRVEDPHALPGAQLAWTRPYPDTKFHAAVYSMQWDNPRPDTEIKSIDILPVENPRGTAALLAITAATTQ